MMRQRATVLRRLPEGRVVLRVQRESACSGDCHHCAGCGAVKQTLELIANDPLGVQPGDAVIVESDSSTVLTAAALVYLLPLALFLVGYLVVSSLRMLTGALGFVLGLAPAFAYNRRLKRRPQVHTVVMKIT